MRAFHVLSRAATIGRAVVATAVAGVAAHAHGESLDQAIAAALQSDPRLSGAQRQVAAARSERDAANGLSQPRVSVEALYNRFSEQPAYRVQLPPLPTTTLPIAQEDGWASRLGVSYPVYTGGMLASTSEAATAALDAAGFDRQRLEQDVKLGVAEAYFNVLRAQQARNLADSGVAALHAHRDDVERLLERDLVARGDALAARAAAANADQDRIRAATALEIARSAYNRLLGRPLDAPVTLDDVGPQDDDAGVVNGSSLPLPERAEVLALARKADALRHQADAARAATLPQVVLSAGYDALQNRYLAHEAFWNVAVGVRWSLFDGAVSRSQSDALEARAAAMTEARADLQAQIALQVRAAGLLVDESHSRIAVAAAAVEQAEENFRVARDRYQSGVGTNAEVLDAEALRVKSKGNYFDAVYEHALAMQRLKRARGEL
jgi:outer membrane protein TolC